MCTLKFNVHLHEDVEELRIRHRRIIDSSMLNDDQQQHEMFAVIANVRHHFWFAVFRLSNRCDIRRLVLTVLSKLRRTPYITAGGLVICEFRMWEWVFCESGVCASGSNATVGLLCDRWALVTLTFRSLSETFIKRSLFSSSSSSQIGSSLHIRKEGRRSMNRDEGSYTLSQQRRVQPHVRA